jgi:tetratricopeptide (TPR) repeat protein
VLGLKGVDMVQYRKEQYEEAFQILQKSVTTMGLKSKAGAITAYFQSASRMLENNKIEKEKVIEIFGEVIEIAEHQLGKITDEKKKSFYISAKENIEILFAPIASCEDLIALYSKKFEENKDNADWLKKATGLMNKKGCTDAPLFVTLAETLHLLEPSAESAYNMGKMMLDKSQHAKANTYLNQAVELQENPEKKADYLIMLANHCFKNLKQPEQARYYALKAASVKPGWGLPYITIGNMYAASAKKCGSNEFEISAVYWAAVDKYIRAKSVDPTMAEDARKKIATFSKYFPNKNDVFFNKGLKDGGAYTIECWINETTKVRVQQ